jgi:hypothetical protein
MARNHGLSVINMTAFFRRELVMYALGDIRLPAPLPLKKVFYGLVAIVVWGGLMISIFGMNFNPWFLMFTVVPPLAFAHFATKPVWGGRGLFDFIRVNVKYIKEPKGWTDLVEDNELESTVYSVNHEIWISRRREYQILADIRAARIAREENREVLSKKPAGNKPKTKKSAPRTTTKTAKGKGTQKTVKTA